MKPLPQFPASSRDWTVTLVEGAPIQQVMESLKSYPSSLLESVSLLDIYRNPSLGGDRKNVTFRFVYRDAEKTVEQEAVDKEHARLIETTLNLIPGCLPPL